MRECAVWLSAIAGLLLSPAGSELKRSSGPSMDDGLLSVAAVGQPTKVTGRAAAGAAVRYTARLAGLQMPGRVPAYWARL